MIISVLFSLVQWAIEIMDFETGKIPFKNASLDLADWDSCLGLGQGIEKDGGTRIVGCLGKIGISGISAKSVHASPYLCLTCPGVHHSSESPHIFGPMHALNAFLFGHGLMTLTLADVLMLTGLDVLSSYTVFSHRNDQLSY
jgi:hypothetical protein